MKTTQETLENLKRMTRVARADLRAAAVCWYECVGDRALFASDLERAALVFADADTREKAASPLPVRDARQQYEVCTTCADAMRKTRTCEELLIAMLGELPRACDQCGTTVPHKTMTRFRVPPSWTLPVLDIGGSVLPGRVAK